MALTHEMLMQVLPEKQRRIYSILAGGGKYSAADLSVLTHYSDPRGHIRDLRNKGIAILDEWRDNSHKDERHKVYYLAAEGDAR